MAVTNDLGSDSPFGPGVVSQARPSFDTPLRSVGTGLAPVPELSGVTECFEGQSDIAMVFDVIVLLTAIGIALCSVVGMVEWRVVHYV